MNYDHLLTRIFDVKEKTMLYKWDKHCFGKPDYSGLMKFITCCDGFMICEFITGKEPGDIPGLEFIPYGDRFIPMLCSGRKDQNKKLIYEHDIIRTPSIEYVVERYKGMFIANYINDYFTLDDVITQLKSANVQIKISGNIHENLNPLLKGKNHDKRSPKKTKSS